MSPKLEDRPETDVCNPTTGPSFYFEAPIESLRSSAHSRYLTSPGLILHFISKVRVSFGAEKASNFTINNSESKILTHF